MNVFINMINMNNKGNSISVVIFVGFLLVLLRLGFMYSNSCKAAFDKTVWRAESNDILKDIGSEYDIQLLTVREDMLCDIIMRFMGIASSDTIYQMMGSPVIPNAVYSPNKIKNVRSLSYPVGLSASGPNCLVLYFNENDILFDYELLEAR